MKTRCLAAFQTLALLALFILATGQPARAAGDPAAVAAPTPIQLAWDRVGSPIRIHA